MAAFDNLAVKPGRAPMEAKLVDRLPDEAGWQFEPKWDGFRCLAWRDGADIELQSKSGKSLARFFPEVVARLRGVTIPRFVIDGELIIPIGNALSFDALQMRLHPAESRIRKLALETPAQFMLFDCLHTQERAVLEEPLSTRRYHLEALHAEAATSGLLLSPCTVDPALAQAWLERTGGALDGVVAKARDLPYQSGKRAMLKVKQRRSADCVVGGFRYASAPDRIGSLLLGLYNDAGRLDHVGFTTAIPDAEQKTLTTQLEALIEPPGFTGKSPGGASRWTSARSADWHPLRPELVVEVRYDQVTGNRFRHGTKFLRWRPDKAPVQCRMDQLQQELPPEELTGMLGL